MHTREASLFLIKIADGENVSFSMHSFVMAVSDCREVLCMSVHLPFTHYIKSYSNPLFFLLYGGGGDDERS